MSNTPETSLKEDAVLMSSVTETLTAIVRQIVSLPGEVRVELRTHANETTLMLYVSPEDLQRMLANGARTVRSLRCVTDILTEKLGNTIRLEIDDSTKFLPIV